MWIIFKGLKFSGMIILNDIFQTKEYHTKSGIASISFGLRKQSNQNFITEYTS